jgi:hypothetical protein
MFPGKQIEHNNNDVTVMDIRYSSPRPIARVEVDDSKKCAAHEVNRRIRALLSPSTEIRNHHMLPRHNPRKAGSNPYKSFIR